MQQFLGDPDSGMLNLQVHRLTLAIAKKMLDENHFKAAHKTMDRNPPTFKIGDSDTSFFLFILKVLWLVKFYCVIKFWVLKVSD